MLISVFHRASSITEQEVNLYSPWFLLYNTMNQPQIYIYPLPLEPSSSPPVPPLSLSQSPELSSLRCVVASHWLSIYTW